MENVIYVNIVSVYQLNRTINWIVDIVSTLKENNTRGVKIPKYLIKISKSLMPAKNGNEVLFKFVNV